MPSQPVKRVQVGAQVNVTGETPFAALQERIDSIEDSIRRGQEEILRLKSEQNTFALPNKLPDEILAEVFMYIAHEPGFSHIPLIKSTHVCSRWRQIALHCPRLWTKPNFANLECAEAMLERAKPQLLHIEWNLSLPDIDDDDGDDNDDYAAWHMLRRRNVLILQALTAARTLVITEGETGVLLDSFKRCPEASYLHALTVKFERDIQEISGRSFDVLQQLVRPRNGNLQSIHLEGKSLFSAAAAPFASRLSFITSLTIILDMPFDGEPSQHATTAEAIKCLQQFPDLRRIRLVNALSPTQATSGKHNIQLANPQLQALDLEDDIANIIDFLQDIRYPPATALTLRVEECFPISLRDFLIFVKSRLLKGSPIRSVALRASGNVHWDTKIFITIPNMPAHGHCEEGPTPPITIILKYPLTSRPTIQAIVAGLSLSEVDELEYEFRDRSGVSEDIWKETGTLPRLNSLRVKYSHPALLEALKPRTLSEHDASSPVHFATLQHMCLDSWTLYDTHDPESTPLATLLQVLKLRQDSGVGIKHLELLDCAGISEDTKKDFEGFTGFLGIKHRNRNSRR